MEPPTDTELLRRYAHERSEIAFGALVQRHLDSVYSVALRQVGGDAHLAADVTQMTFLALARKASSLTIRATVGGWLYRTTHFTARDVVRGERRRRAREQEAHTMTQISNRDQGAVDSEALRHALDHLVSGLKEAERDAIWLRFFEGLSFAEIGHRLGLAENAARMRVERALAKLRSSLARRGISCSAAALAATLAGQTGTTAPIGLGATVTGAVTASVPVAANAALSLTVMSTAKIVVGVTAVAITGMLGWAWRNHRETTPPAQPVSVPLPAEAPRASLTTTTPPSDPTERRAPPSDPQPPGTDGRSNELASRDSHEIANVGRANPRAALQTLIWATNSGDSRTVAASLFLTPEAREKAAPLFARMPEDKRQEHGSVERLIALLLGSSPVVDRIEVFAEQAGAINPDLHIDIPNDDTYRTLKARLQYADGRSRETDFVFQQTPTGWRWLIVSDMIDKFSSVLTGEAPLPPSARPGK